jgi:hypothetical protein
MAATVDSSRVFVHGDMIEQHTVLSALTDGATETVTLLVNSGVPTVTAPLDVNFEQTVDATSGTNVGAVHLVASDSTSGNTVAVRFRVAGGEDISGAKVKVKLRWLNVARQDGQSLSQDNDS